jgi:tetratricopeptide (TPR) repeat protein
MSPKSHRPAHHPAPGVPTTPNPLLARAAELFRQGRFDEAEALVHAMLSFAPRQGEALHLLGMIARQKGDNSRAIDLFRQAIAINRRVAAYHGNLGNAYLQSSQIGEAAGCFRRVLALEPDSAQAHFGLGLALLGQTAYAAAERELTAALRIRPDHPSAHLNLGIALTELGRFEEAVAHCQRAAILKPGYAGNQLRLGMALKANGDLRPAYGHFLRAIELNPQLADAHFQLGVTLIALNRPEEAVRALRQALVLRPDMVEALQQLGWVLKEMEIFDEAIGCYERALTLDPQALAPLRGIGQVLYAEGRFEEARAQFGKALELDPDSAETCVEIGRTYEAEGRFTEAIAWQEKAIAIQPDNAGAHYSLAMMRRFDNVEARLHELERVLELPSLDNEGRTTLHFTVARMYDEIGNLDTAFRHYKMGNDRRKARQAYEPTEYSAFVDRVIETFDKPLFDEKKGFGSESRRPVFIVGMMRSGTTLVEQILASHPQVYGHGELWSIRDLARALPERLGNGAPYPECVAALTAEMTDRLAGEHLARLERDAGEAVRSTDKLPHNFLRLGFISLLFPRAQLIHCTRDPFDTCLSCYFLYNVNAPFAHDLEFLGRFYRDYQRLMSHWRSTLPSAILDVPYEGLVATPEVWSRKLIDFLGLEWDDRCLAFYENERPVYTPSFWQVRQPIYASSIGRWRHYAKHLGPLFDALEMSPPME